MAREAREGGQGAARFLHQPRRLIHIPLRHLDRVAYQELSYKKQDFPKGRYLYCQYYNTKSKKSLFGYEFLLETNN